MLLICFRLPLFFQFKHSAQWQTSPTRCFSLVGSHISLTVSYGQSQIWLIFQTTNFSICFTSLIFLSNLIGIIFFVLSDSIVYSFWQLKLWFMQVILTVFYIIFGFLNFSIPLLTLFIVIYLILTWCIWVCPTVHSDFIALRWRSVQWFEGWWSFS